MVAVPTAAVTPSPVPPPPPRSWSAPAAVAVRGVELPVVSVRAEEDGRVEVPDPLVNVGWWTPSALPGQSDGTTVLVARAEPGEPPAGVLRELQPGETVQIRDLEGQSLAFVVESRQEHGPVLPAHDVFVTGGAHRLVLLTSAGEFDPVHRSYADNVVVVARPLATVAG